MLCCIAAKSNPVPTGCLQRLPLPNPCGTCQNALQSSSTVQTAAAASSYAADVTSKSGWVSSWETSANKGSYTSQAAWESGYKAAYKAEFDSAYSSIQSRTTD